MAAGGGGGSGKVNQYDLLASLWRVKASSAKKATHTERGGRHRWWREAERCASGSVQISRWTNTVETLFVRSLAGLDISSLASAPRVTCDYVVDAAVTARLATSKTQRNFSSASIDSATLHGIQKQNFANYFCGKLSVANRSAKGGEVFDISDFHIKLLALHVLPPKVWPQRGHTGRFKKITQITTGRRKKIAALRSGIHGWLLCCPS